MSHKVRMTLIATGLSFLCTIAFAKKATVTVYGGQINYNGQVVNAPCVVSINSQNQQVVMGQVRSDEFSGLGSWSDAQSFTIELQDCDTSLSSTVGILFRGVADTNDPQVFQVGGGSAAKGIGLGIFNDKGQLIVPNSAPLTFQVLNDGNNTVPFIAKYRETKMKIQPGDANATIDFSLVYP